MVLYKNKTDTKIDKVSQKLPVLLSNCETSWNIGQQEKLKARLQGKLKKGAKVNDYTKRLLQKCKLCSGVHLLKSLMRLCKKNQINRYRF